MTASPTDRVPASTDTSAPLLSAIAAVRQRFIDAAVALRQRPSVRDARTGLDCRAYLNGTTLELYLEADVVGRTICWWLDAAWRDGRWEVGANVAENRDYVEGQRPLHNYTARHATTGEALVSALDAAASQLLATAQSGDIFAPAG